MSSSGSEAAGHPQHARGVSALLDRITVYAVNMNEKSSSRSLGQTVVAGLIVLVVGYFLLKVVIGIAVAVAGILAVVLAIVAVIWAVRVLF
jgi:protein-S-isoprenylcysteine O-methyltransferase Ste14